MAFALITGCSSGFGLATALKLAENGVTVVATMRDLSKAEGLRSEAQRSSVKLDILQLDATSQSSRAGAIAQAMGRYGHIDILVNNAGVCWIGATEELGENALRDQFETNVFGAFSMATALLPSMRARCSGRIVNVTSVVAFFAPSFMTGYAATKHALDALTIGMDHELREFNVRVISVAPGVFGTHLSASAPAPAKASAYGERPPQRFRTWIDTMEGRADISPVVDAIVEAATAAEPKPRYVVTSAPPPYASIVVEKNRFDESRRHGD